MTNVRKFAYDTVFDEAGGIVRDGTGFRSQYNSAEVEQVRAEAFEQGKRDGLVRAEEIAAGALAQLSSRVGQLLARLEQDAQANRAEALAVAVAAARKAAGAALDACGETRVLEAVENSMAVLPGAPRLLVRVSPDLAERVRAQLEEMAKNHAYAGAIIVRGDAAAANGDVAIEWADCAIALGREETFRRIEEIITQTLSTDDQDDAP